MNSSFGGPNNSPSGLSSKKALFDERDLVQKFIPTHSSKHPDVIHHNIQRQFDLLFLHNFHKTVGNPMIDFSRILALFMGLREHHNCLHESQDTTPLANCHECLTLLFNEIQDASAYVCEVLNEAREKQPKVFGWEEKASSFDSDEGFFVKGSMPCKNRSSRQCGRKPTTPQPSPSPSQSQSVSLSTRQSNKKAFKPTSRRFEPNPPSLIITRIQDRKLLSQNRSHFKQAWHDLCGKVFPSGNTPHKFSFDNIDVIEQHRSSIPFTKKPVGFRFDFQPTLQERFSSQTISITADKPATITSTATTTCIHYSTTSTIKAFLWNTTPATINAFHAANIFFNTTAVQHVSVQRNTASSDERGVEVGLFHPAFVASSPS